MNQDRIPMFPEESSWLANLKLGDIVNVWGVTRPMDFEACEIEEADSEILKARGRRFCRHTGIGLDDDLTRWFTYIRPLGTQWGPGAAEIPDHKDLHPLEYIEPEVRRVIVTIPVLHVGWEMDNWAWLVELVDGSRILVHTSHGCPSEWPIARAEAKLAETETSARLIREALALLGDSHAPGSSHFEER